MSLFKNTYNLVINIISKSCFINDIYYIKNQIYLKIQITTRLELEIHKRNLEHLAREFSTNNYDMIKVQKLYKTGILCPHEDDLSINEKSLMYCSIY